MGDENPYFEDDRPTPLDAAAHVGEWSVGGFWQWAFSDLNDQVVLAALAEFVVARAVGAFGETRTTWTSFFPESNAERRSYGLVSAGGSRMEVCIAAGSNRFWNVPQLEHHVSAHAVVFVRIFSPLAPERWQFFVVPKTFVANYGGTTIAAGRLQREGYEPVRLSALATAVARLA